jgi:hypothetical protein
MDEAQMMELAQPVIKQAVFSFCAWHPLLDPQELEGDCQIECLRIVRKYDSSKNLQAWVWHCMNQHLRNRARRKAWLRQMSKSEHSKVDFEPPAGQRFSLTYFLNNLTVNSRRVVYYVLGRKPDRETLRQILREEMHIPLEECVRIFKEIREALE